MSNDLSSLTEDHVRQLGHIIERLERSTFDFLQLEVGDLKVTIGKGDTPVGEGYVPQTPTPVRGPAPLTVPTPAAPTPPIAPPEVAAMPSPAAGGAAGAGTIDVTAPIMGMFYTRPEPGAAPFVTEGASVAADSTVGLVEVMKTFNAVTAGVSGTIVEVCAPDAQIVEYGQVLFRVARG